MKLLEAWRINHPKPALIRTDITNSPSFLPERLIQGVAALMFVIGAIILFREARSAEASLRPWSS